MTCVRTLVDVKNMKSSDAEERENGDCHLRKGLSASSPSSLSSLSLASSSSSSSFFITYHHSFITPHHHHHHHHHHQPRWQRVNPIEEVRGRAGREGNRKRTRGRDYRG